MPAFGLSLNDTKYTQQGSEMEEMEWITASVG